MSAEPIAAPLPISRDHDAGRFDCGRGPLNDWIRSKAARSEGKSARCFVVCVGARIVGYYCMSAGAVRHHGVPRALRANMPDPTPVIILGRLAVDTAYQGRGIGKGMLKDALSRMLEASKIVGARAILVHAIDDAAVPFYASFGFKEFPDDSLTLYLPVETICGSL